MDEEKFWKNSLGTTVGPMIAGPALVVGSANASSFGGSNSASSSLTESESVSAPPVFETQWELNNLLGTVTFRYSSFAGLVLSRIIRIEDASDAYMIPIDELSNHAVKVVSGVIKKGGDKYEAHDFSHVIKHE